MFGRPKVKNLTPAEVRAMLDSGECVLVDVREPDEFAAQRVQGAVNVPLSSFDADALPREGERRIVLQCGSGKRSALAAEKCAAAGVAVSGHLAGGILAWTSAGQPVER
jgi:rhodanese-related sulfurtransferase